MEVGDKVLVMPALGENMAVPLGDAGVGDSVILYSLKNESRIAIPTLTFSIGNYAFNTPAFNFSGFNFNLDFNFNLLTLCLAFELNNVDDMKLWQGGSLYDLTYLSINYPNAGDYYYHTGGTRVADVFIRPISKRVGDIYIVYTGSSVPEKHSKVILRGSCISWNQPGYYSSANEGKKIATVDFITGEVLYAYDPC